MNKPKQNPKTNHKKALLVDGLYDYLRNNNPELLLLNPQTLIDKELLKKNDFSLLNKYSDLLLYKKEYSSKIDKLLLIISQNISLSLFSLNNEKYTAFMSRYDVWGFDLTMLQFIINYYLVVKTDNMLRLFILEHMDKVIKTTRSVIEKYLIMHMGDFSFKLARTLFNKRKLLAQMKLNQMQIDLKLKNRDKTPVLNLSTDTTSSVSSSVNTTPIQLFENSQIPLINTTSIDQISNNEINVLPINTSTPLSSNIPQIISMTDMMNMSEELRENVNNISVVPAIEDNLSGIQISLDNTSAITNQSPKELLQENLTLPQSKNLKEMEQLILDKLKKLHLDLLKGLTNNV